MWVQKGRDTQAAGGYANLQKGRDTKKANAHAKLDALLGSMEVRQLLGRTDGMLHKPQVYKYWERLQSSLQSGLQ